MLNEDNLIKYSVPKKNDNERSPKIFVPNDSTTPEQHKTVKAILAEVQMIPIWVINL